MSRQRIEDAMDNSSKWDASNLDDSSVVNQHIRGGGEPYPEDVTAKGRDRYPEDVIEFDDESTPDAGKQAATASHVAKQDAARKQSKKKLKLMLVGGIVVIGALGVAIATMMRPPAPMVMPFDPAAGLAPPPMSGVAPPPVALPPMLPTDLTAGAQPALPPDASILPVDPAGAPAVVPADSAATLPVGAAPAPVPPPLPPVTPVVLAPAAAPPSAPPVAPASAPAAPTPTPAPTPAPTLAAADAAKAEQMRHLRAENERLQEQLRRAQATAPAAVTPPPRPPVARAALTYGADVHRIYEDGLVLINRQGEHVTVAVGEVMLRYGRLISTNPQARTFTTDRGVIRPRN